MTVSLKCTCAFNSETVLHRKNIAINIIIYNVVLKLFMIDKYNQEYIIKREGECPTLV